MRRLIYKPVKHRESESSKSKVQTKLLNADIPLGAHEKAISLLTQGVRII